MSLQIALGHQHAAQPFSKEHKSFIIIGNLSHNQSNKIITEYLILNFFFIIEISRQAYFCFF